ncbi:hypothetical protein RD792_006461 [Penstemon davidsonii]|uniref:Polygalacturonase n=1 Tax=Penstemon davidsonii TaxID=160366 RepID=A0ABR0DDY8_9LAMI|nr:hypothetical protein RD792_006461 [Penstemon davidsonii]
MATIYGSQFVMLLPFFLSIITTNGDLQPKYFDVTKYGAVADGKTDNTRVHAMVSTTFLIKGTLKAPTDPSKFFTDTWIGFRYLENLVVKGGGFLDGQGSSAWKYNDCQKNSQCKSLPVKSRRYRSTILSHSPPVCAVQSTSAVQIKDVTFDNIWGTSSTKVALSLQCSGVLPCKNVKLININLAYHGPGGPATSTCSHVIGSSYGKQIPGGCL